MKHTLLYDIGLLLLILSKKITLFPSTIFLEDSIAKTVTENLTELKRILIWLNLIIPFI